MPGKIASTKSLQPEVERSIIFLLSVAVYFACQKLDILLRI